MMWENKINEDEVMRGEVKAGDLMKVKKFILQDSECAAPPTKLFLVMDVKYYSADDYGWQGLRLREVKSGKEYRGSLGGSFHKKEGEPDDERLAIKNPPHPTIPGINKRNDEYPYDETIWKRVKL
jgi:hypothetical protein